MRVLILVCFAGSLLAQRASVPFVGCDSYGQGGLIEAPRGRAKTLPISSQAAGRLAYYESGTGAAVVAPRGWDCFGKQHSGGVSLSVRPEPFDRAELVSAAEFRHSGPGIEIVWAGWEYFGAI